MRTPRVNRLIEALPSRDRRRLVASAEVVALTFESVLNEADAPIAYVYFPLTGLISVIIPVDESASLEVGLIGDEGMFGIPLALDVDVSPLRAVVQGAGSALRLSAARFRRELERSKALRVGIDRYVFVRLSQLAQTAGCTRFHVVEARLARWLLMTQDRVHAASFHITQEFLAMMLGVRRVGVTRAASSLQSQGLIQYTRGNIDVLDRRGLRAASCMCYQADIDAYARIFG
jgi:CRP-like cAMP-binding protein